MIHSTTIGYQYRAGGTGGAGFAPHIYKLTLFQPGGVDYAQNMLLAPRDFESSTGPVM